MLFYGNASPDAELVVLYGNCQTPFLAMLLAAAYGEKGYLCVLNHAPPGQVADQPTPEQMRRCCLYLEQYDSQPELPTTEHTPDFRPFRLHLRQYLRNHCPDGCPRIVFPGIVMPCMWPWQPPECLRTWLCMGALSLWQLVGTGDRHSWPQGSVST